jgi:hypothetical protein
VRYHTVFALRELLRERASLDQIVLDRTVSLPTITTDRVHAAIPQQSFEPRGLCERGLRDVDIRRIEHDVVMRNQLMVRDDCLAAGIIKHALT